MEWTDIRLTVSKADAEAAEAVATMIAEGGIYIEDYSDIEEQVEQIAHVDLIEQELLDKPRDTVIIHMYLEPGASPVETLALIAARMEAAGIPYTSETEGVEQEDWQNGWRKYYHPMDVGQRLAIVPSWPAATRRPTSASRCWTSGSGAASGCWTSAPAAASSPSQPSSWAQPWLRAWTSTPWPSAPPARTPPSTAWPTS